MDAVQKADIQTIPTTFRKPPPTKFLGHEDGQPFYRWYITEDEYHRLCKVFGGRDFQETGIGATLVVGQPQPCKHCGKYTEFIDWVWTAIQRKVHTADFMFEALKDGRQSKENMHDVYCSRCGTLTDCRSRNNAEGGAPNILLAGPLQNYDRTKSYSLQASGATSPPQPMPRWGKWWLDDEGNTAAWRNSVQSAAAETSQ
ncbi:hypothetical protein GLOTRDRAFT_132557 [Gloeophyllum trabeum ATCC 11539]|uniref:Uncharacterized protein n=1 Tax=Gloeophyllum trabeum (strain ATCC 11539 / FP-39264 / Madison 617) TaxID=670483 RepID=S7RGP6_GLOTA|nr:uncharacterized protein GLOTRDRAFT_132557 [Gloeophyllum trabeum ATCC 11539]EPQ51739.1 hypothetical protein GLOTRDRAFT_132557 [Gloeophyllum trabeum ATCC 11539]